MSSRDDAMDRSLDEKSEMPSLILPFLYLGGKVVARSRETLDKLNICSIVNCTPPRDTDPRAGVPNFYQAEKERFTYRRVPVFDSKGANLSQYFSSCADFIDKAKHHGAVLVHCVQGVSRSTSIVLAYLMKKKGVPLEKALNFVRKRRPVARPNRSFMKQLQDFEHRCMASRRQKASGVRVVSGPARPTPVPAPAAGPAGTTGPGTAEAAATPAASVAATGAGSAPPAADAGAGGVGSASGGRRKRAAAGDAGDGAVGEGGSGDGGGGGDDAAKVPSAAAAGAGEGDRGTGADQAPSKKVSRKEDAGKDE